MRSLARLGLVGILLCAACEGKGEGPAAGPPEVVVVEVQPQDVPIFAEFLGVTDGDVNAEIRARVAGYVESVNYQEGQPVKAGDLLFKIDPVISQAAVTQGAGQLETAKAALFKANNDVARLKPLAAANAVSKEELDNALAAQQSANAAVLGAQGMLAEAQATLGYTKVTSPIDGVAGLAKVKVGTLVGKSEPTLLTTVSRLDPIRVTFTISEQQYLEHAGLLEQIRVAAAADPKNTEGRLELYLADGSKYPQKGRVALIDRAIDPTTGTMTLQAVFANPNNTLRPGLYAKVRGVIDTKKGALVVPQRAVRELQGVQQIAVVAPDGKVDVRNCTMGPRVGSQWVVEKCLAPGDKVVIEGLQKIKTGMQVTTKPAPAPAPPGSTPPPGSASVGAP